MWSILFQILNIVPEIKPNVNLFQPKIWVIKDDMAKAVWSAPWGSKVYDSMNNNTVPIDNSLYDASGTTVMHYTLRLEKLQVNFHKVKQGLLYSSIEDLGLRYVCSNLQLLQTAEAY